MPDIADNTKSYESLRESMMKTTLREFRISMMQSRGYIDHDKDPVLQKLNGTCSMSLSKYLEDNNYRNL